MSACPREEDRAILDRASRTEIDPATVEVVEVECGKCCQVIRAPREHVEKVIERRRQLGLAVMYKCAECYL